MVFSTNSASATGYPHGNVNLDTYLIPYTKTILGGSSSNNQASAKNTGEYLCDLREEKDLSKRHTKNYL